MLPRLTMRSVRTTDLKNNNLYTFKYNCLSGYVTVIITDNKIDDNY